MYLSLRLFNQLYTDYQKRLVRFAVMYVRDLSVAEDCVMESLISLWENREEFSDKNHLLPWLLTVLKNKCIGYLRREQRLQYISNDDLLWELNDRILGLEDLDPKEIFTKEIQDLVDQTLTSLPEQTRRIFIMSTYENMSHEEIAEITHLSIRGVEYHIYKAKDALKLALRDYLPAIILFVYFC